MARRGYVEVVDGDVWSIIERQGFFIEIAPVGEPGYLSGWEPIALEKLLSLAPGLYRIAVSDYRGMYLADKITPITPGEEIDRLSMKRQANRVRTGTTQKADFKEMAQGAADTKAAANRSAINKLMDRFST